jgi:Tol biopolymer transport system component
MSGSQRFDRNFADLLAELAEPQFPDYFDDVLTQAIGHRQRPAWTFPERWFPMSAIARRFPLVPALPTRTIGLLLMLLLLLAASLAIGVGAMLWQQRAAPQYGLAANGVFAYAQDGDIYSAQPDGSQARLIIGGPTMDAFPSYSRDGRSVYFLRLVSESPDVIAMMVANADGSGVRTMVEPEEAGGLHWSSVSPKGDVMALANESVSPRFSMINLADGTRTAVELPVEVYNHEWVPTGDEILLVGREPTRQVGIYAAQPDGSSFRTIVEPRAATDINSLSVSDDGRYIAYGVRAGNVFAWRLLELATGLDSVHPAPIGQHQTFSAFSPDSTRVAFVRYSDERASTIDAQVFVGPLADPSAAVAVGPRRRIPSGTAGLSPQFSPDATKLVIASDEGEAETWLVNIATGEYEELPIGSELGVSWQRRAP